ncbi:MAG: ABC transporter substrate-binding protein [Bacillota bacterium]|nr:ABC transporter substrate-binding protein [Bacillota bacterium]
MKKTIAMLLAASMVCPLAACGGAKKAPEGGEIKIGTISPNTGAMAVYGEAMVNAYDMAAAEINADGGINGKKVVLVKKDDQMDPTESLNAFNALVAEGVDVVLGAVSSGCTAAITDAANEEEVLLLTPTSTADSITTKDDYVFRTCYADSFQGKIAAKYAKDLGCKEVGVLYCAADTYSKGLYDSFANACKDYGINVVAAESAATMETIEFSNQWAAIKAKGVGFVFAPFYYYTVGPYVVPQARTAGYTGIIMGADGYDSANNYISQGSDLSAWNNVMFTNHYDPADKNPVVKKFVTNYKTKYNDTPNALAALAYDGLYMIKKAMEKAGAEDAKSVRDALADTSTVYKGVTGTFTLDKSGTPVKGATVVEYYYDKANNKVATKLRDVVKKLD